MGKVAIRDDNFVAVKTAVLNTDGASIVLIKSGASTHGLKCSNGTSGSDKGPADAQLDDNNSPTWLAVSSSDGTTIVPLYADSNGNLLIQST